MALTVPAPARAEDTHARLVQAAADVFAEKGYDGAGVAEIARRAGLTTGAIYSRFSGKAELLAEAIRSCGADELDQLFAEHGFDGRAADILRTVGSHLVTRHQPAGEGAARSLLLEAFVAARRDAEVRAVLREHLLARAERLTTMVEVSKDLGAIDPSLDTAALVHFAHAVGLGFLLFEALDVPHPDAASWQAVVDRLIDAVVSDPTIPQDPQPESQENPS